MIIDCFAQLDIRTFYVESSITFLYNKRKLLIQGYSENKIVILPIGDFKVFSQLTSHPSQLVVIVLNCIVLK